MAENYILLTKPSVHLFCLDARSCWLQRKFWKTIQLPKYKHKTEGYPYTKTKHLTLKMVTKVVISLPCKDYPKIEIQ